MKMTMTMKSWVLIGVWVVTMPLQAITIYNNTPYELEIKLYNRVVHRSFLDTVGSAFEEGTRLLSNGIPVSSGQTVRFNRPDVHRITAKFVNDVGGLAGKNQIDHDFDLFARRLVNNDDAVCFCIEGGRVVLRDMIWTERVVAWWLGCC